MPSHPLLTVSVAAECYHLDLSYCPDLLDGFVIWSIFPLCSSILLLLTFKQQLGIIYVIVTTVLFLFPPELPVTGSNMSKLTPFRTASFGSTILILSTRLLHSSILHRHCDKCYPMVR